jgi:hypothetical protein
MAPPHEHWNFLMTSDRRQKKLVNISVQKAIAFRLVSHSLLFVWSVLLVCVGLLDITGPGNGESLVHIRTVCLTAIGVSIVVVLPAIVYDSIKFSHRMAGPVIRLKNMLPAIGVEHLDHIGLRKNDFWQEFAADFNAMLDRVETLRQAAATTTPGDQTSLRTPDASVPANIGTHA